MKKLRRNEALRGKIKQSRGILGIKAKGINPPDFSVEELRTDKQVDIKEGAMRRLSISCLASDAENHEQRM